MYYTQAQESNLRINVINLPYPNDVVVNLYCKLSAELVQTVEISPLWREPFL